MSSPDESPSTIPVPELVVMAASLMALNALAIDVMLPALGLIADDLGVTSENDRQLVVVSYVLGFGAPQLAFGPLADRFGRRPVLFVALAGYTVAGLACALAPTFTALLVLRFVQGVFASGCRVVAVAVVRDLFKGRGMARIMSLVMTVFMIVPILAPGVGQVVLWFAPWRWTFGILGVAGMTMFLWTFVRLRESLPPEERSEAGFAQVVRSFRVVLRSRVTLGYMLASGTVFAALFAFISSCEQIFREVFHQEETFALWFGGIAVALSAANFANSRLVGRFGMRRISHLALVGFTVMSGLLYGLTRAHGDHLWLFLPLFTLVFAQFGLIGANFNALAMEPLGKVAGTASAVYGFSTTTLSGFVGGFIGRQYDGTTMPIMLGYVGLGLVALAIVATVERGRLFRSDRVG
ncbi:MAG: multidrug effflux MFS transporter [Sandaracinaceae bacterium]